VPWLAALPSQYQARSAIIEELDNLDDDIDVNSEP
jgi:hypothetical protein